jgi:hypothetical protein
VESNPSSNEISKNEKKKKNKIVVNGTVVATKDKNNNNYNDSDDDSDGDTNDANSVHTSDENDESTGNEERQEEERLRKFKWIKRAAFVSLENEDENRPPPTTTTTATHGSHNDIMNSTYVYGIMVKDYPSETVKDVGTLRGAPQPITGGQRIPDCILLSTIARPRKPGSKNTTPEPIGELFLIGPIEQRYKLFTYDFSIRETGDYIHGKKYHKVVSSRPMQRRPLTLELLREIMLEMVGMSPEAYSTFFQLGAWNKDKAYIDSPDTYVFNHRHVMDAISQSTYLKEFQNDSECKRYFMADTIDYVCKYYVGKTHMICTMTWEKIQSLYDTMMSKPHILCFRKTIKFYWYTGFNPKKKLYKKGKNQGVEKIPELDYEAYKSVIEDSNMPPRGTQILKVYIYDMVKREKFSNGHMYVSRSEILSKCKFMNGKAKVALDWLAKENILFTDGNNYYLYSTYQDEISTAYAFEEVAAKKVASMNAKNAAVRMQNVDEMSEEDYDTLDNEAMDQIEFDARLEDVKKVSCSEQLTALSGLLTKPFLIISGKGGSGKTSFLKNVMGMYKRGEVIATAFQNNHVVNLMRVVNGYCFTSHTLLNTHDATCAHSPYQTDPSEARSSSGGERDTVIDENGDVLKESKLGIAYKKCILENIRVLIVDEMSLMYESLFVKLVCALVHCGKLESIILSGDINQNRQIAPGDLMRSLTKALKAMGCFYEFNHNHRVKSGSEEIDRNLDHIKNCNPDGVVFNNSCFFHIPLEDKMKIEEVQKIVYNTLYTYKLSPRTSHIITRTNDVKKSIMKPLDMYSAYIQGKTIDEVEKSDVNKKISFKITDLEAGVCSNEILFVRKVEDVSVKEYNSGQICTRLPRTQLAGHLSFGNARIVTVQALDSPEEREIKLTNDHIKSVIPAGVTTVHMFQGMGTPDIVIVIKFESDKETMQGIYTAVGRAMSRVFVISSMNAWRAAILNKEEPRRTLLADRILHRCDRFIHAFNEDPLAEDIELARKKELQHDQEVEEMRLFMEDQMEDDLKKQKVQDMNASYGAFGLHKEVWYEVALLLTKPDELGTLYALRTTSKAIRDLVTRDAVWKRLYDMYCAPFGVHRRRGERYFDSFKKDRRLVKWWKCPKCEKYVSNSDVVAIMIGSGITDHMVDVLSHDEVKMRAVNTVDSRGKMQEFEESADYQCECGHNMDCNVVMRLGSKLMSGVMTQVQVVGAMLTQDVAIDWGACSYLQQDPNIAYDTMIETQEKKTQKLQPTVNTPDAPAPSKAGPKKRGGLNLAKLRSIQNNVEVCKEPVIT